MVLLLSCFLPDPCVPSLLSWTQFFLFQVHFLFKISHSFSSFPSKPCHHDSCGLQKSFLPFVTLLKMFPYCHSPSWVQVKLHSCDCNEQVTCGRLPSFIVCSRILVLLVTASLYFYFAFFTSVFKNICLSGSSSTFPSMAFWCFCWVLCLCGLYSSTMCVCLIHKNLYFWTWAILNCPLS